MFNKIKTLISGDSFRKLCDFSVAYTSDENQKDAFIVRAHQDNAFDYLNTNVKKIKENDLVYCKTDYLAELIDLFARNKVRHKIKLITGQSDYPITDDLAKKIKKNISTELWSINVETKEATPIPLGIANSFCKITAKNNFDNTAEKTNLLYVNHRIETNYEERAWLYPYFSNYDWATVRQPWNKGVVSEYQNEMKSHKFILCPRGNGIDTHRIWESVYTGVIPVVKRHITHAWAEGNLPILFVDDFKQINKTMLEEVYEKFSMKEWNSSMVDCEWWIKKIRGHNDKT